MPTPLEQSHSLPAPPERVFALLTDRTFLERRLAATKGLEPSVVSLEVGEGTATVVTRQSIPAAALPSMVSAMISGDPVTERTEKWVREGDGYRAELQVVIKGAPASINGTMALDPAEGGSTLRVDATASVPIPLFGGRVESVVVTQVHDLLDREGDYTSRALSALS